MKSIPLIGMIFAQLGLSNSFCTSNHLINYFPHLDSSTQRYIIFPRSKTSQHSPLKKHEPNKRLKDHKKDKANSYLNLSNINDDDLIEKAKQLRKEAFDLESQLAESRDQRSNIDEGEKSNKRIDGTKSLFLMRKEYKTLNDSCWLLTYRFSKNPKDSDLERKEDKTNDRVWTMNENSMKYFTGKLCLRFRVDGYSEMISFPENENDRFGGNKVIFDKVWGWDEETSNEDNLKYLLFSADIIMRDPSGPSELETENSPSQSKERFYFQARIDTDRQKNLELVDGTVTVKRELNRNNGGRLFWGIFDGSGILAQFYNVGYFSCKPIRGDLE